MLNKMASIQLNSIKLAVKLEKRILELQKERQDFFVSQYEISVKPLRGQRIWWFGRLKTDQELISTFSHFHPYFWETYLFEKELTMLEDVHRACRLNEVVLIMVNKQESKILHQFNIIEFKERKL